MIRYADDAVMVFSSLQDAKRVMAVLPKRFGKYGLALHPEKTKLVTFTRPEGRGGDSDPVAVAESFDLLGFTHSIETTASQLPMGVLLACALPCMIC